MSTKTNLRPVVITHKGKKIKGYFHRFVYSYSSYQSQTQALVEHIDGRLRYYDPYFVQFTDRFSEIEEQKSKKPIK